MACTIRSPATPVPYSFQHRQRAKMLGSKGRLGTSPCQVSQSRFAGERSGGGGYCQAPVGSLRPSEPSTSAMSPIVPSAMISRALAQRTELIRWEPIWTSRPALLRRRHHLVAVGDGMGHRLLAVDVLARAHRVHHDLLVPVVGHRGHDAVDALVVQELLIAAGGAELVARDLPGQGVAAVVEVAGGRALHAGNRDRGREQPRTLHAHADHSEADAVAGGAPVPARLERLGLEMDGRAGDCGRRGRLQELATGRLVGHAASVDQATLPRAGPGFHRPNGSVAFDGGPGPGRSSVVSPHCGQPSGFRSG